MFCGRSTRDDVRGGHPARLSTVVSAVLEKGGQGLGDRSRRWGEWQGSAVQAEAPRLLTVDVIKALQHEPRGTRREEARLKSHCVILK